MVRNPFVARGMIKSEKRLWGREWETQTIHSLLLDSEEEPQSIAIVGLRKIGKSSLLYRVAQKRGAQPMYADQLDRTVCVMLSMQAMSSASPEEFFVTITEELSSVDNEKLAESISLHSRASGDPSQHLRQILRLMDKEEYRLVLLLDEFECAATNPAFDKSFFDLLRSMAQPWRMAFIVATQRTLDQLWDQSLISSPYSSPFFNIFQTLTLTGFQDGESEKYLRTLSRDAGIPFEDPEVEIAIDAGGQHPFFLTVAAYHVFQELNRGNLQSPRDRDAMWMQITQDPTVYANLEYYWQTLPPPKRRVLTAVASSELEQALAPERQVDLDWLRRMGLVREAEGETFEPFSRAFRDFLLKPSLEVEEPDVGHPEPETTIQALISQSEGSDLEFKSSLRWDYRQNKTSKDIEMAAIKTLAAFLNTNGGTLIIGVDDESKVLGLEKDYASFKKKDRDGFELYLMRLVSDHLGKAICHCVHPQFHSTSELDVCKIEVDASIEPVYVGREATFYIRTGNSTQSLNIRESVAYVRRHWNSA